jgi:hypothetical protein
MLHFLRKLLGKKEVQKIESHIEQPVDIEIYKKTSYTIEAIIAIWKLTDLKLNGPATLNQISEAESKIGLNFPDDFKKFYSLVNGFEDGDMTEEMFSIWDLDRIIEEVEKSDNKNFIPFCDYCINSHQIGYIKNKVGVFKSYNDGVDYKIADTFEETLQLIIDNSELLY